MKRKTRLILLATVIIHLGCASAGSGSEVEGNSVTATTVILIRHAERDNFFILTPRGHEQARALVDVVGDMGITAIYSPNIERNLDTVRPLAIHLGLDITLTPRIKKQTVDRIISDILNKHAGAVVLLVGNGSGNLRSLHQRLGGIGDGPYPYGDLYIYKIPDQGPVQVIKSRY